MKLQRKLISPPKENMPASYLSAMRSIDLAVKALKELPVLKEYSHIGVVSELTWQAAVLSSIATAWAAEFENMNMTINYEEDIKERILRLDEESREEGYDTPTPVAKDNASKIVKALFQEFSYDVDPPRGAQLILDVYPTRDREVAIDIRGRYECGILILCFSDGGVLCLVTIEGKNRRARYKDAEGLPDSFIIDAINDLK